MHPRRRDNPIHLTTQVSGITPEEFGVIADSVFAFLKKLDFQAIVIPPMPRHFTRCCVHLDHFDTSFDGRIFVQATIIYGIFLARSLRFETSPGGKTFFTPHLGSIFGEKLFDFRFTEPDGVHPTESNLKILSDSIADLVRCINVGIPAPHLLPRSIPEALTLGEWFPEFVCNQGANLPNINSRRDPRYDPPGSFFQGAHGNPYLHNRGRGRKRPRTQF